MTGPKECPKSAIRAVTLFLPDPSAAAAALSKVLGWSVESDVGSFASLTPPEGIPLWINVPGGEDGPARGVYLHIATDDVDASYERAIAQGAISLRSPTDMDFGERSACVTTEATPGVTLDFSRPLG